MAIPTVTATTQNYTAAPDEHIPLSNLFSASDSVNGQLISDWVFYESPNNPHGFLYIEPASTSAKVYQPDKNQYVPVKSGLVAPGHAVWISSADLISGNLTYLAPHSVPIGQSVSDSVSAAAYDPSGWSGYTGTTVTTTLSSVLHEMIRPV
jgi:hypothetical protein